MVSSRIQRLSATDIAQIKSSVVITSLQDVVVGLVKNSLDAGATYIAVHVNFLRGSCEVNDDGQGIAAGEFVDDGGLLKQYSTSKRHAIDLHGCHGTFLTSVGSMALLTIFSSHSGELAACSMTMHHSKVVSRMRLPPEDRTQHLGEHGTLVTVRDLFGNMPVRVKHRTLLADGNELAREWASLVHDLSALLLAWPELISLDLFDEHKLCQLSVKRKSPTKDIETSRTHRATSVHHLLSILTQAKFIESTSWPSWVPTSASTSSIRIRGAISLDPAKTKRHQFISFGVVPLQPNESSNELFAEINRIFQKSRFGVVDDATADDLEMRRRGKDGRFKQDGFTNNQLQGGRKGIERWPMFCFKVSTKQVCNASSSTQQSRSERDPQIGRIIDLMGAMVTQWLTEHHFRPLKWRSRADSRNVQHLWLTTPRAVHSLCAEESSEIPSAPHNCTPSKRPFSMHKPTDTSICSPAPATIDELYVTWVHPVTKQGYLVDKQSGAVSLAEDLETTMADTENDIPRMVMPLQKSIRLESKITSENSHPQSAWVQNVLEKWNNPVFAKCGHDIPRVNLEQPEGGAGTRITGLDKAEIISQLDKKFILIKVSGEGGSTAAASSKLLVIVDQHAADERVKIEGLLQDLCTGLQVVQLQVPLRSEVPIPEASSLQALRDHFSRWGITYNVESETTPIAHDAVTKKHAQLLVTRLPNGIAERCTREPQLLIDMLRAEALDHSGHKRKIHPVPIGGHDDKDHHSWLRQTTGCPTGLVDMLNSRACRSAIMFNDHLDIQQCKDLVARLSKCALPFQCAHGRPSMVPLVAIGNKRSPAGALGMYNEYLSEASDTKQMSFAAALRSWRQRL